MGGRSVAMRPRQTAPLPGRALDNAALTCDIPSLRALASSLSASELAHADAGGRTAMHRLAGSLFFLKAGELSSLVPWPNASRTIYKSSIKHTVLRALGPIVRTMLERSPSLATAADERGVTVLHLAARICADGLVRALLRAGASPSASLLHARRTPLDEAMSSGCIETVRMLIAALPGGTARREAEEAAAAYATLAGAALLPRDFPSAMPRARPRIEPAPEPAAASATCAEGGGWDVEAPPSEAMRTACDLDQLSGLSAERYLREYYLEARPVMLLGVLPLAERCAFARDAPQMAQVVAQKLRCGRTAYPALTGQSACGLFSLLDLNTHPSCDNTERALPVCARKPTGGEAAVNTSLVFTALPTRLKQPRAVPAVPVLAHAWSSGGSRQFFAGGRGSGAALHFHNAAYNIQLFGNKRWLLTPPRFAGITGGASSSWLAGERREGALPAPLPLQCTQGPGDLILVPPRWGHATINDRFAIGMGNLYCDVLFANYTDHPHCSRFYPRATRVMAPAERYYQARQANIRSALLEALGLSASPDR